MTEVFVKTERCAVAVYLHYNRDAKKLQQYGDVLYHSRKMRYVMLYVDQSVVADTVEILQKERFVKNVLPSYVKEIDHQFVGNLYRTEEENVFI